MADIEKLFNLDNPTFEDNSHSNGQVYWYASDFINWLGYKEYHPTMSPITKAMSVCLSIPTILTIEHFREDVREINGKQLKDFKLSRFACYLVAMNSDVKKEAVAKAQAYFAAFTAQIHEFIKSQNDIDRVPLRKEISEWEKSLSSTAKHAGVQNYAFFNNKGYIGLYNMSISEVKRLKNIPQDESPLNYMGAEELGANIFRLTQTDAKIRREQITGQSGLENAAKEVGQAVRRAIKETGGTMPEHLPAKVHIDKIKKDLKNTNKEFTKEDKKLISKKKT